MNEKLCSLSKRSNARSEDSLNEEEILAFNEQTEQCKGSLERKKTSTTTAKSSSSSNSTDGEESSSGIDEWKTIKKRIPYTATEEKQICYWA